MAIQRSIGSVSIAPLPMASRAVTPLPAFCAALSSIPCLKHCCAGSMNSALIRANPSLPLMARCYAAPFGKCQGCSAVGHGLRYRKWAGVKPESNPNKKGKSKPSKMLDILELKGAVVTLDALHCQRDTGENQREEGSCGGTGKEESTEAVSSVQSQFQALFDAQKEKIVVEHKESGHGRQEERYVFQLKAKLPPELTEKWPTIRSIIAVERHRSANGKGTVDTSYYVSSLSPSTSCWALYTAALADREQPALHS